MKGELQRGILFMSFAGEELGLLGSAYWVQHPTMPIEKAVAMLNMDMIGRIKDDKVFIGGVGTGSTLKPMLEQAAAKENFQGRIFSRRLLGERSHFFRSQAYPGAVLLFRPALGLSQAV